MKLFIQVVLFWLFSLKLAFAHNILIDAGHGGSDLGASRIHNGVRYYEKNLVLDTGHHLYRELKSLGHDVGMTRTNDQFISVEDRLVQSRKTCKKMFVSLHMDALEEEKNDYIKGATVYVHKQLSTPQSRALARKMQTALNPKRKVKSKGLMVLRNQNCPSILVEMGYMTNPEDLAYFAEEKNRRAVAHKMAVVAHQQLTQAKPVLIHDLSVLEKVQSNQNSNNVVLSNNNKTAVKLVKVLPKISAKSNVKSTEKSSTKSPAENTWDKAAYKNASTQKIAKSVKLDGLKLSELLKKYDNNRI